MSLADEVKERNWYHTIDLPGGVTTAGLFDTRAAVDRMWFPESLAGKRCLDVGTCDGFWAFEMEKRGASEVVGIDVDDPGDRDNPSGVLPKHDIRTKKTFYLAKDALGSRVERVPLNVYDLSPEAVGRFDFAFVGSILLHLRDPIRALEAVRSVTDELLVGDTIWLTGTRLFRGRPVAMLQGLQTSRWWTVNLAGLQRMVVSAGYEIISSGGPYYVPFGPERTPGRFWRRSIATSVSMALISRIGVPHGWVHARPRTS
jgi:tRNA (mo5U34)-methyltransferase